MRVRSGNEAGVSEWVQTVSIHTYADTFTDTYTYRHTCMRALAQNRTTHTHIQLCRDAPGSVCIVSAVFGVTRVGWLFLIGSF